MAKHMANGNKTEVSTARAVGEWIAVIGIAVAAALTIRAFVAEIYEVPSGSMLDTIQLGDRLIGEKLSYHFKTPQAGEVVTFIDPDDSSTTLIKRVIATAGQTVDLRDGVLYIDGVAQDEPYTEGKPSYPLTQHSARIAEIQYPYTVPDGCIWVMGDSRTNSLDSRYFGPVSVSSVTSHGLFIFWPVQDAHRL